MRVLVTVAVEDLRTNAERSLNLIISLPAQTFEHTRHARLVLWNHLAYYTEKGYYKLHGISGTNQKVSNRLKTARPSNRRLGMNGQGTGVQNRRCAFLKVMV